MAGTPSPPLPAAWSTQQGWRTCYLRLQSHGVTAPAPVLLVGVRANPCQLCRAAAAQVERAAQHHPVCCVGRLPGRGGVCIHGGV
eukprot:362342-Chlamydomonas_euryale.AAC.10